MGGVATDGHLHREGEPLPLHSLRLTPNDTRAEKRPADLLVHEPFNYTNQAMPQHRSPATDQGRIATWPGSRRATSLPSTLVIGA